MPNHIDKKRFIPIVAIILVTLAVVALRLSDVQAAVDSTYAWLAEKCFVTESTVRNWMARKLIPAAKEHIIRELMKELPLSLPSRVVVTEETRVTLSLDPTTRKQLEKKAFAQGKTLAEFLADEVPRLGE